VSFVFSPRDPAKRKVENKQVKLAEHRALTRLLSKIIIIYYINKTSPCRVAERDLRNKAARARSENTLISGGAGQSLINKT
jgi:hypothetical protein